ncbi:transposase-like protein [Flavobacterium gossypii]|uniref:Transposase-like protein n=1 Tax=Flavobacterium gossypii TaxID=1646119 RepID=A0ABR6DLP2_9FLAO|nr:IS1595 family transposase [Flavobacterium gossypii]MBA9072598.1 transposase-like protein [Flavobacterium gossypii]
MFDTNIKSMLDLMKTFPTEQSCIDYLENIIWAGTPVSPFDPESKVYKCKDNKYKCKNSGKYFNIKTSTFLGGTKVGLQKWMLAIWLVTSHKKGISSLQLGRDIDVSQKTAWFMLMRIRKCFGIENANTLEGTVECDESFYGGRNINRHKDKKVERCQGRSFKDKTPILGMLQRGGKLNCFVVPDTKRKSIQPLVRKYVTEGTRLISDEWHGYTGLSNKYNHEIVNHAKKEYVNLDDPTRHSNTIESSWKIMKNSLRDMYNSVSKKHLQDYVDEHVYRYNMRLHPDSDKFNWMIVNGGVRTRYMKLIA